jgi:uncharacterized membrane protein YbhN (UPF0104 family)
MRDPKHYHLSLEHLMSTSDIGQLVRASETTPEPWAADGSAASIQLSHEPAPPVSIGRPSWRPRLLLLLKFAAAGGILGWLIHSGRLDVTRLARIPFSANVGLLWATVLASMVLPAVRWWWLLRVQRLNEGLWRTTVLAWVGYATALVLPGAASGDLARSYFILRQQPQAHARALSTVLVDRFIGLYGLLLVSSMCVGWLLIFSQPTPSVSIVSAAVGGILIGATLVTIWVVLLPPRRLLAWLLPAAWLAAWRDSYRLYRAARGALLGCLLLSLLSSALFAVSFSVSHDLLGGDVSWSTSFLISPLLVLANCIPLTPGGIGLAETAASELCQYLDSASGAEVMLLLRLTMAVLSLPGLAALGTPRGSAPV